MDDALRRYARQVALPRIGEEGQRRLLASSAAVVGVGALGSVIASILVRAGVGRVRLIDRDLVEESNLQRQELYDERDLAEGLPKAVAAERRLRAVNAGVRVEGVVADLTHRNVERLLGGTDAVLDGSDNFETRLLVNDHCVRDGRPFVYAGVIATYGHTMAILPGRTACFRCYVPDLPPPGAVETCETAGVLAPAVHLIAALAAAEGLKLLAGRADEVAKGLLTIDAWTRDVRTFAVAPDPLCPCCGRRDFEFLRGAAGGGDAAALCGRDAVQVRAPEGTAVDLAALAARLQSQGGGEIEVAATPFLLRLRASDGKGPLEATVFPDGRAIVRPTSDLGRARSFYARYVGS